MLAVAQSLVVFRPAVAFEKLAQPNGLWSLPVDSGGASGHWSP
jgi:hypothetical protein